MSKENNSTLQKNEIKLKRELRKAIVENRKLLREIDALKSEIDSLKGKKGKKPKETKYQATLRRRNESSIMFSKKNYFFFIFSQIKYTSFFHIYARLVNIIRRYSFITISFKVISVLFVLVEATALVVLSTSAFVASVIFTILASHIFAILTFFTRKKHNVRSANFLKDKNVTVFFPPKERAFERDSYFSAFVLSEAKKENHVVVIVSPFMFKATGIDQSKKAYHISRSDGENILLVRRSYYFTLRKKFIDTVTASVTEIY